MHVLILGVNGFIGHSLLKAVLTTTDWQVIGMDLDDDRIREHLTNPRFDFTTGDIVEQRAWVDRQIAAADVLIPLAGCALPAAYVRDPLKVFELCFEEHLRIVRQCVEHETRVVFPSTSEVYGMCPDESFNEETSPLVLGPVCKERWIYSGSKQMLDRVIWAYGARGLDFTIFRPFNWFGPNLDDIRQQQPGSARVLTQFLGHLLRHEPICLVDGGEQRRCFTHIDDGIDALMRILRNEGGCASGRIFNVGNPANDCSIRDLATTMIDVLAGFPGWSHVRKEAILKSVPSDEYYGRGYQDMAARRPDIKSAQERLGWEPKVALRDALVHFVGHYLKTYGSALAPASAPAPAAPRTVWVDSMVAEASCSR